MKHQLPVYSPLTPTSIAGAALSGLLPGHGDAARALTERLRERFTTDAAILTGSGTQALHLAMTCVEPVDGNRAVVALPAYSCFDLVSAAVGAGVRVRFYDVDPITLSAELDSLRSVLREGVSAVVAGNLHGYPLDWRAIRSACDAAGVSLIEDAAQGVGTAAGGSVGDATVLSFGRGKGWTGGGGGALLLRGPAAAWLERLEEATAETAGGWATGTIGARAAGVTAAAWLLGRPWLYGLPSSIPALGLGETRYKDPVPPSGISSFSAALALRTEGPSLAAIDARREMGERWLRELDGSGGRPLTPCRPIGGPGACSFLRLPLVAEQPRHAEHLATTAARFGVARGYPVPLHRLAQAQPVLAGPPTRLPGAEQLAAALVTLPTHAWVTDADMRAVVGAMRALDAPSPEHTVA